VARIRLVVGLVRLLVVVEARERPMELAHAQMAQRAGRLVAAVPGRVSSPLAAGPHALIRAGAPLVRGPQDVLDLLYDMNIKPTAGPSWALEPRLRGVLDRVSRGQDTLGKLARQGPPGEDLLVALTELEIMGALIRGDGGRYLPAADFHKASADSLTASTDFFRG
jgi:DNA processing protein